MTPDARRALRLRWTLGLLLSAAVHSACADGVVPDIAAIRRERKAWREQGLQDYTFVWRRACFCDWYENNGGVRIVVRDGQAQAESAIGQQSGIPQPRAAANIDQVFAEVLDWATSTPSFARFEIEFDTKHHFIKRVDLDQFSDGADDEYSMGISCFSTEEAACALRVLSESECVDAHGSVTPLAEREPEYTCVETENGLGQVTPGETICCKL